MVGVALCIVRRCFKASVVACVVALGACGGGGGGGSGTPSPPPPPASPPAAGGATSSSDGCSVAVSAGPFDQVWPGATWQTATPESQGLCPDALETALAYAFQDGNHTGAVLVAKNGYLVAERYADDRGADDLATSWSVAKSFTSALLGAARDDGLLTDLDEQRVAEFVPDSYVADWRDTDKSKITIRHMMTLRTALRTVNGAVLYGDRDQLGLSLRRELIGEPGEKLYSYSDGDVMIGGQVARAATGSSPQHYLDQRIGAYIGFAGEWWQDERGNVMTYCCIDATPRHFVRFGLLYARGGEWNGDIVLSAEWVRESTAPALAGEYAYYWWPAAPVGRGFAASGLNGQLIAVYPEEDLVVTRFSRYERMGDGTAVKVGVNHHSTLVPQRFDNATFLAQAFEAVEDSP